MLSFSCDLIYWLKGIINAGKIFIHQLKYKIIDNSTLINTNQKDDTVTQIYSFDVMTNFAHIPAIIIDAPASAITLIALSPTIVNNKPPNKLAAI